METNSLRDGKNGLEDAMWSKFLSVYRNKSGYKACGLFIFNAIFYFSKPSNVSYWIGNCKWMLRRAWQLLLQSSASEMCPEEQDLGDHHKENTAELSMGWDSWRNSVAKSVHSLPCCKLARSGAEIVYHLQITTLFRNPGSNYSVKIN